MVTKITKKFHPTSLFLPETLKKHEKMNKKKFAKKLSHAEQIELLHSCVKEKRVTMYLKSTQHI